MAGNNVKDIIRTDQLCANKRPSDQSLVLDNSGSFNFTGNYF